MVVQFRIARDAEVPAHTHPHEQIGHVVSGQMRFRIGDEVRELGPGRRLLSPGGVVHGAIGVTDVHRRRQLPPGPRGLSLGTSCAPQEAATAQFILGAISLVIWFVRRVHARRALVCRRGHRRSRS